MHLFTENTRFTFGQGERKVNEHTVNNGSLTHVKDCVVIGVSKMTLPSLQHGGRQGKCEGMVIHGDIRECQLVEAMMASYDSVCNCGPAGVSDPARRIIKMGGKMIATIKGQD